MNSFSIFPKIDTRAFPHSAIVRLCVKKMMSVFSCVCFWENFQRHMSVSWSSQGVVLVDAIRINWTLCSQVISLISVVLEGLSTVGLPMPLFPDGPARCYVR